MKTAIHKNELAHRYLTDVSFKMQISLYMSLGKYRVYKSPVMSAAKAVKLAAALVSMLSLETAMLTQFDEGKGPEFRQLMTGITGGCVCVSVLVIAVFMIIRSTVQSIS